MTVVRTSIRRPRRGSLLLEVAAAAVILIACCGLLAQLMFLVAKQERLTASRQVAERAVANRLEQLVARNWEQLPAGKPVTEPAPDEVRQLLPSAELHTQVTSLEDDTVRRIRVEIHWQNSAGETARPIGLAAWKHRPPGETQP